MEMIKLRNTVGQSDKSETNTFNWKDLLVNPGRWAFVMAIGLGLLYELCGVVAMLNYTGIIFQEVGSNLSPDISTIIVGAIQFIGSLVTTNLVDRAGRRVICSSSRSSVQRNQIAGLTVQLKILFPFPDFVHFVNDWNGFRFADPWHLYDAKIVGLPC